MRKRLILILAGLGLYLLSAGLSYAAFGLIGGGEGLTQIISPVPKPTQVEKAKYKVDPALPREEVCPLTGAKFTKEEKEIWEKRRPLAVMLENSHEARPHSGLGKADIVYEALAEGWITRFMAVFYCQTPLENITIAPVRSARTYFLDWVSEYDALYSHVGGANRIGVNSETTDPRADALSQIERYGIKDLDQFGIGYPDCYRNPDRLDHPVATEHTMVCFSENLYRIAEKRGWTNIDSRGIPWDKNFKQWLFKDDEDKDKRGDVGSVAIVFAQGYEKYDVLWNYDKETNSYKRVNGGVAHFDLEANQQITAKNVIIQLTKLTGPIDSLGHLLYTTIGRGKALIFQDGKVIDGSWEKKTRVSRTVFFDGEGKELVFTRGPIWIEIVPTEKQVSY